MSLLSSGARIALFATSVTASFVLAGCGDSTEDVPTNSDNDHGTAGSAGDGGGGSGNAGSGGNTNQPTEESVPTTPCLGSFESPVSTNSDGVLTTRPHVSFTNTGDDSVEIVTANFWYNYYDSSGDGFLSWAGHMVNRSNSVKCGFLGEVTFNGQRFNTVADGHAYYGSGPLTTTCLQPGELGVFHGIESDISQSFNSSLSTIEYGFRSFGEDGVELATDGATLSGTRIVADNFGYTAIEGSVEFGSSLYNYEISFFPRDCGMILKGQYAFPGDLDNVYDGTKLDFKTVGEKQEFADFVYDHSWISNESSRQSALDADPDTRAKEATREVIRALRVQERTLEAASEVIEAIEIPVSGSETRS